MRIVFCGSGVFAVPSLRAILASGHELVGVFTQPPRPAGRGGRLRATAVADAAQAGGLAAEPCEDINSPASLERLAALAPDVIVVADFGQFVRRQARAAARLSTFNLHGSVLPGLRGAAPVNWAIIRGLRRTGVTTFELVDKMDAGPVYMTAETDIAPLETAEELRLRLAELGSDVVVRTLDLLDRGEARAVEQDHSQATLAPRLTKADGLIAWSMDAESIRRLIHGTWPWPAARAVFQPAGRACVTVELARAEALAGGEGLPPGQIDAELCVSAGEGRLRILEIKPAGGRLMPWRAFVNGYRVKEGDGFVAIEP